MPTSVEWVKEDLTHIVTAYSNADCVIYDIETGNPVIKLDTMQVMRMRKAGRIFSRESYDLINKMFPP